MLCPVVHAPPVLCYCELFIPQAQQTQLEGAYRAKDELLAVRETEVQQIPLLRTELKQLHVGTMTLSTLVIRP